jgi:O-antigen ligase
MGLLAAWQVTVRRSRGFLPLIGLWSGTLVLLLPFMLAQAPLLSSRLNLNAAMTTSTPETQSLGERSLLIRKGVEIFWRHPLSGVGVGAFPLALMESIPGFPFDYQPPHWVLVDVAAETGLPGAASYAFLSLAPWALLAGHAFRIGIHRLFRSSPWKKLEIASLFFPLAVASALLLALNLVSLLDYYPWMLNPGRTWHWMAWGAWSGAYMKAFGGQNG